MVMALGRIHAERAGGKVRRVSLVLSELKQNKASMLKAGLLSLLLQVNVILYTYVVALSMNLRIPLMDFFVIVPIVLVILILPVSINGIGLRENAYALMFAGYITGEEAVAFSWELFALTLFLGAVGGVFYIARR